jgi:predicted amidohydrolase YtcJ
LPTAGELDRPTTEHPVVVKRGVHKRRRNSQCLGWPGSIATPDPAGGTIVRDAASDFDWLVDRGPAPRPVERLMPQPSVDEQMDGLRPALRGREPM